MVSDWCDCLTSLSKSNMLLLVDCCHCVVYVHYIMVSDCCDPYQFIYLQYVTVSWLLSPVIYLKYFCNFVFYKK